MRRSPLPVLILLSLLGGPAGGLVAPAAAQPTSARLAAGVQAGDPLLAIDSLFYIANRGLTRVRVRLNDYRFTLASDPEEVARSANAFLIPRDGTLTIHIGNLLVPDDDDPFDDTCEGFPDGAWAGTGNNCIDFLPQGPDGAGAQVIISDVLLVGEEVAYAIRREDLQPLPNRIDLLQSYPNPFRAAATLTYTVPEDRATGVPVRLAIYDVAGRLVRTLVDDRRFPGTFTAVWDGLLGSGAPAPSGLYLARLEAGEQEETIRLVRLR